MRDNYFFYICRVIEKNNMRSAFKVTSADIKTVQDKRLGKKHVHVRVTGKPSERIISVGDLTESEINSTWEKVLRKSTGVVLSRSDFKRGLPLNAFIGLKSEIIEELRSSNFKKKTTK